MIRTVIQTAERARTTAFCPRGLLAFHLRLSRPRLSLTLRVNGDGKDLASLGGAEGDDVGLDGDSAVGSPSRSSCVVDLLLETEDCGGALANGEEVRVRQQHLAVGHALGSQNQSGSNGGLDDCGLADCGQEAADVVVVAKASRREGCKRPRDQ